MSRLVPAVLDVLLVLVFAAVGRRSHAEGLDLAGLARTALPFLVGAAAGWLLASIVLSSGPRTLAFGAVVVAATVVVGMVLRAVAAQGVATSFVIVASVVLTVFLLGWRLLARFLPL